MIEKSKIEEMRRLSEEHVLREKKRTNITAWATQSAERVLMSPEGTVQHLDVIIKEYVEINRFGEDLYHIVQNLKDIREKVSGPYLRVEYPADIDANLWTEQLLILRDDKPEGWTHDYIVLPKHSKESLKLTFLRFPEGTDIEALEKEWRAKLTGSDYGSEAQTLRRNHP